MKMIKLILGTIAITSNVMSMESTQQRYIRADIRSLDHTWNGEIKLKNVINMPEIKSYNPNQYRPNVRVIDVFDGHGQHVSMTVKKISPSANLTTASFERNLKATCLAIIDAAEDNNVDIINLSLGVVPDVTDFMTENCIFYKSIKCALEKGKIVVKSLGNDQESYNEATINNKIKKLNELSENCASNKNIKGRLILVGNSSYRGNYEHLQSTSNRSKIGSNKYVITAPGTDITALINNNDYQVRCGTSMATPMVTGVICQIMHEYTNKYMEKGIVNNVVDMRSLVSEVVLGNARKNYFGPTQMPSLPNEFGRGVIDYGKSKSRFEEFLNKTS